MKGMDSQERDEREALARDEDAFEALLGKAARVPRKPAPRPHAAPGTSRWVQAAAAVVLVVATGLWVSLRAPSTLPVEVAAHVRHEPGALVRTDQAVPNALMDEVLRQASVELVRPVGLVSYVKLCPFRGKMVAHFVVQGEKGPVTVLLLPDEDVVTTIPIREEGIVGTLVPLEIGGSIAVVGDPGESLDVIRDRLVSAVRWQI